MRRFAIRLGGLLLALLVVSQFAIPPYLEHHVANRLTDHGGSADVEMGAIPAVRLLFGHGDDLHIRARGLSVDLEQGQADVFKHLDDFGDATVTVTDSRAGPFRIGSLRIRRNAEHTYAVTAAGDGTPGDIARYAAGRLGGGLGEALAGLAAGALGDPGRPIPFAASMRVQTGAVTPQVTAVTGDVAGLPAGPLIQIVANALLSAL